MFFLASSKLLPRTVSDRLLHSPCQPSSFDQKSQAIGMVAITSRVTTSEVIIHPTPFWLCESIIKTTDSLKHFRQQSSVPATLNAKSSQSSRHTGNSVN